MWVKRKRREINVKERKKMVGTNEGLGIGSIEVGGKSDWEGKRKRRDNVLLSYTFSFKKLIKMTGCNL